ncbi:MAG: hypothetical protein K2Y05_12655 [Hyphomicrobiaceae bacterium]|nr:hypothetical protein [Hyphomicrobiaceae bacterium]
MGKRTRVLSGESARTYFRALFAADPSQTPASVARLADTCVREIAELRVRIPQVTHRVTQRGPAPVVNLDEPVPAAAPIPMAALTEPAPVGASAPDAFDPFAFSLIVVYRRDGRDALLSRLKTVGNAAQLKEIAKAQHVGLPPDLNGVPELCAAIVAGTERRVAHREAAAS